MSSGSTDEDGTIMITFVHPPSGKSDSIPISAKTTTLNELMEWSKALLGLNDGGNNLILMKDGKPLSSTTTTATVEQAGIKNGDLIAIVPARQQRQQQRAAAPAPSGGLDFSNLLGGGGTAATAPFGGGGLDFSNLLGVPPATTTTNTTTPIYYQGMNLEEAMIANPHPECFISLIFQHDLLWKELNYYQPNIAQELLSYYQQEKKESSSSNSSSNNNIKSAANIWRQHVVKNGISNAMKKTQAQQEELTMQSRLVSNPNDIVAKSYFQKKENQQLIQQQYFQMMQEYPESMGRVLMLYINAKVNGIPIQTFVDSGAQSTIMSYECAKKCNIDHLIDERFSGIAVGVGTGKIMGRVHLVGLEITDCKSTNGTKTTYHFPCTITVMESLGTLDQQAQQGGQPKRAQMDFLLGLDMLKRHSCLLDLKESLLKFRLNESNGTTKYLCTPFLHEKDLDVTKGGTKGFDAQKANEQVEQQRRKQEDEQMKDKKSNDNQKMEE